MKRILLLTITLLFVGIVAYGQQQEQTFTETPVALDVSYNIDVQIIASSKNYMTISGTEEALKYFRYSYDNGKLVLSRTRKTKRWSLRSLVVNDEIDIKLYISDLDRLKSISASGASEVTYVPAKPIGLQSLDLSGASEMYIRGDVELLEIGLSGASELSMDGNARSISVDGSGASEIDFVGDIANHLSVDLSGASDMNFKGSAYEGEIEVSGASDFDGSKANFKKVWLEASGASGIVIRAEEVMQKSKSGASSIRIRK